MFSLFEFVFLIFERIEEGVQTRLAGVTGWKHSWLLDLVSQSIAVALTLVVLATPFAMLYGMLFHTWIVVPISGALLLLAGLGYFFRILFSSNIYDEPVEGATQRIWCTNCGRECAATSRVCPRCEFRLPVHEDL